MHLYLTNKLLKAFKKAEKIMNESNDTMDISEEVIAADKHEPFFSWHGNLMTVDQDDCLVLTNDGTGLTLIFLSPYEEDYLEFGDWLSEAMARMMQRMGFSKTSVNAYFNHYSKPTASKASNAALIGKNSAALNVLHMYTEQADDEECFQETWSYKVSMNKKGEDGSQTAIDAFSNQFEQIIGTGSVSYSVDVAELEVRLKLEGAKDVIRIIQVPMHYSFDDLHTVIQKVFLWNNSHFHQFILEDGFTLMGPEGYYHMQHYNRMTDDHIGSGAHHTLSDAISYDENSVIRYIYDLGDSWEHVIKLRKIWTEHKQVRPRLKMMMGDPVPEDIGGAGGYAYYLEVMNDPEHPDHDELKEWARPFELKKRQSNTVDKINKSL